MIPAKKNRFFNAWFTGHAQKRIQHRFAKVLVQGLDAAKKTVKQAPVLVISNHVCWWDPLVALTISELWLQCDGHALMDAKNLRRLPFFSLIGAFGVDLENPADGAASIKYAARLLNQPQRLLWVFPQGRERPAHLLPLGFRPGSAEIARVAKQALTLPVGLSYAFCGEEKPYLYVSFGEALKAERDTQKALVLQEQAVAQELARIQKAMENASDGLGDGPFECRDYRPPSRMGAWAEQMLAWMTRPLSGIKALPSLTERRLPPH